MKKYKIKVIDWDGNQVYTSDANFSDAALLLSRNSIELIKNDLRACLEQILDAMEKDFTKKQM